MQLKLSQALTNFKGPATPLGTPGTPIAHAHTPINNLMNQMNSMNLGTPGTPQPPHPQSQQMMGPWSTPDHNQPTGKQDYRKEFEKFNFFFSRFSNEPMVFNVSPTSKCILSTVE